MLAFALAPRFSTRRPLPSLALSSLRHPQRRTVLTAVAPPPRATLNSDSAPSASGTPPPTSAATAATDISIDTPANVAQSPPLPDLTPADRSRIDDVREQLEFWFSASNLRRDWYLRRQMDDAGWLDPAVFLLFNRLKRLNASLEDIIMAARLSDELDVQFPAPSSFGDAAAQTRVRRSATLPDFREWDEDEIDRSFAVHNVPPESTVDSLMPIFAALGPVAYLRVYRPKAPDMPMRGLICFADKPTADRAFEQFAIRALPESHGMTLRRRRVEQGVPTGQAVTGHANGASSHAHTLVFRIDGLPSHLDWKTLHKTVQNDVADRCGSPVRFLLFTPGSSSAHVTVVESDEAREAIMDMVSAGLSVGLANASVYLLEDPEEIANYWEYASKFEAERRRRRAERDELGRSGEQGGNPAGVIVKLCGLPDGVTWMDIKGELAKYGRIIYLNHRRGMSECHARASSAQEAQTIVQVLTAEEDALTIGGERVSAEILAGEEEKEYWDRVGAATKTRRERQDETGVVSDSAHHSEA